MDNVKNYIGTHINKIKFDETQLITTIEMLQYTVIFLILTVIASILWNNLNLILHTHIDKKEIEKSPRYIKIIKLVTSLIVQTFIMTLIVFYVKKIGFLVPPIGPRLSKNYIEGTSYEYVVHVSIFIVFVELIPKYKKTIEQLREVLQIKYL